MANSTGKTIGLILLVILIILFAVKITPLIFAPFGLLSGALSMLHLPDIEGIHLGPSSVFRFTALSIFSFILLIIWIVVIVWVYRDAERRGMNGILWALLVLIGNLIGLIIYLIVRTDSVPVEKPEQEVQTCPNCQKIVAATFAFCPYCASRLHTVCPGCKKPTEKNWKVCPHCGEKLTE